MSMNMEARPSHVVPMTTRAHDDVTYYPAFDWLRGCLAAIVMLYHDRIINWSHAASFAVEVFFALSGWLIGGILLELSRGELPRFFFNRAVRIWVPYFIALAFLLGASLLREPVTAKWLEFVAYKVTFVYNLFGPPQLAAYSQSMPLAGTGNHFWSVNAEEQFYLLAPLLLVTASHRGGRHVLTWVLIALAAWGGRYYASIVFGVLAAVAVKRFGPVHQTTLGRVAVAIVALLSAAGLAAGLAYELIVPVCAVSIVLLLAYKGERRPLGVLVGGMSYPLYLNHWIGVFLANAMLKPFGLKDTGSRQVLAVVFSVGIAVALYWWVDRRLLAKRREMYAPSRGRTVAVLGYGVTAVGLMIGFTLFYR